MSARRFVKSGEAAATFGISRKTLLTWEESGAIKTLRHGTGHRLYDLDSVAGVTGIGSQRVELTADDSAADGDAANDRIDVAYARVSTRKQLDDLKTQSDELVAKHPDARLITDCASGLNFKRKGLQTILELATQGTLRHVFVAHKDRLCRFAFDLIEFVLAKHGAKIVVDAHGDAPPSPEHELAEDLIAVVTVFGARLYGRRSGGRRKRAAAQEGSAQEGQDGDDAAEPTREGKRRRAEAQSGKAAAALEWAASDLQGADGVDSDAEDAAQALLCGGEVGLQSDGGDHSGQ